MSVSMIQRPPDTARSVIHKSRRRTLFLRTDADGGVGDCCQL